MDLEDSVAAVGLAEKVKYDEHLKDASQEPQPLPADLVPKEHGDPNNDIAHQHFPTEEERQTLRRVPEKLSWAIFSWRVRVGRAIQFLWCYTSIYQLYFEKTAFH